MPGISFDTIVNIFSIIGAIASILTLYKSILSVKKVNWKKIEKGVIKLKEKLIADNYIPTLIIGIGRGGSIIGSILSGCLGRKPFIGMDIIYDWNENSRNERLLEEISVHRNLEKVLIVSGEWHSGASGKIYKQYFENLGSKEVKTLTFVKEKYPKELIPDYFYTVIEKPDIKLPWMISKNYSKIARVDEKDKK